MNKKSCHRGTYNPVLDTEQETSRLKKIAEIGKQLADEALHYHHVAKKYKRAQTVAHGSAVSLGSICALLSSAGLATALTGIGLPVGASLVGVASLLGLSSASLTAASKKLEAKVLKHEKIFALATAKRATVSELVSKALVDTRVSEAEFRIILCELEKYFVLKESVRSDFASKQGQKQSEAAAEKYDLEKIRNDIREEEPEKYGKKNKKANLRIGINFEKLANGFKFAIEKNKILILQSKTKSCFSCLCRRLILLEVLCQ